MYIINIVHLSKFFCGRPFITIIVGQWTTPYLLIVGHCNLSILGFNYIIFNFSTLFDVHISVVFVSVTEQNKCHIYPWKRGSLFIFILNFLSIVQLIRFYKHFQQFYTYTIQEIVKIDTDIISILVNWLR